MRVTTRLEVHNRTREARQRGASFADDLADQLGERTKVLAKRNVAPGSGMDGIGGGGPGPHPHRTWHLDTGDLMRSIEKENSRRGFLSTSSVFSDKPYGPHLEFGWTNPMTGNHFRYPWLQPAAMEAASEIYDYAHISARRWLSETGHTLLGRVNIGSPISSTWMPE